MTSWWVLGYTLIGLLSGYGCYRFVRDEPGLESLLFIIVGAIWWPIVPFCFMAGSMVVD
jgi:hypothetical protein